MCGIVGYIGCHNSVPFLMEGLSRLEYRGYDSAGIAVHNGKQLLVEKSKGMLVNLKEKLDFQSIQGSLGIGHTRWATHGAPSHLNSHPHTSINHHVAVVHNGIIENYMTLKDELIKNGYTFISDTDTETAAHLIDFYKKNGYSLIDAVFKALERIEGSYALGVISADHPNELIAARKDSPLVIGLGENENFIASDIPAILNHTRNIYFLDDMEVAVLSQDHVKIYDRAKNEVKKEIFKVNWDIEAAEKGGFDHFMLKEIFEQPKVLKDTLFPRLKENSHDLLPDTVQIADTQWDHIGQIYIVACGTAYYAGLIGKYLLERIGRIPVNAMVASEFRYNSPIIDESTLVIIISQSGETADSLAALRLAKSKKARVMSLVNVVGSSIARESDDVFYTSAGPEIAVASTKAYSSQVACMYLLTCHIALALCKIPESEFLELKEDLLELPLLVNNILQRSHHIEYFTKKYLNAKNVFYIGRGLDYITAMEGSLKLKEIAYVHSEPYAAGELKHGPIALIEESTLIIGVATQESLFEKTASNIKECKARGARVLAIAMEGNTEIEKYADDVFYIPRTHWMFTSVLANIPQQLFAYYMSLGLGNNVDKPRNLAKSVTVE